MKNTDSQIEWHDGSGKSVEIGYLNTRFSVAIFQLN
jgi:hypothetical protein